MSCTNGDLSPHVFTYYTTNNYAKDGNNLGGYNRQHKGWVQYSGPATTGRTLYPGIAITSVSVFDGPQFEMPMQFLLYIDPVTQEGNWWVYVDGIPMGYYPASLYGAGGMSANTTASRWPIVKSRVRSLVTLSGLSRSGISSMPGKELRRAFHGSGTLLSWLRSRSVILNIFAPTIHRFSSLRDGCSRVARVSTNPQASG